MIRSFDEVFQQIKALPDKVVAVAAAEDEPVLEAVSFCKANGLADAILVGDEPKIREIAKQLDMDLTGWRIIHEADPAAAALKAVELVSSGQADMLMKGLIDTKNFLRAVLNKEVGLRTGNLITHVGVFDLPPYDRLIYITDAAFSMYPTLQQKVGIINNAVKLAHALGNENPKVAPVCAVEVVNPDMPATLDAAELTRMNEAGEITGCTVYGPLAFDNAIDQEAATHKKISHPVAGNADIFLMANIEAGNGVFKALTYTCQGERHGGILMGAAAPVIVTSRADSFEAKVNSIALASLAAMGGKK
ncbi:phosphate butyryltransferase [Clostridiaceae bacterium HFYG-1003]|nr:phosphate butyryltransferase [Clostridiaceae bacterium HFYG-1003]